MMAKLYFYPIDLTYKVLSGRASVYIYGRTLEGKQICVVDDDFAPYFYALPEKNTDIGQLKDRIRDVRVKGREEYSVEKVEIVKKLLEGRKVAAVKVTVNVPAGVVKIREEIKDLIGVDHCIEYDIHFTKRYLIDKGIIPLVMTEVDAEPSDEQERTRVPIFKANSIEQSSGDTIENLKVLAFDIEVYNPEGKNTDPERHPIVMIALHGKRFKKVLTWKKWDSKLDYLEVLDGEGEMLDRFKELVVEYSPDILTGYYSDGYDFPYIVKRAAKRKVKLDLGLDHDTVSVGRGRNKQVDNTGIVHIDILAFIRRVISRKLRTDSLKLDNVAGELLGEKKDDVDIDILAESWDTGRGKDLEKFAEYNLKDAKLTIDLFENVLPNLVEMVKIVGQKISDVNRMSFSALVEWYIMRRTLEFDQFIPNKPHHKELVRRMDEKIQGAFVFEPKPGLYDNVAVFDFRSLYPSIIVSHNIGPDMLNCDCCVEQEKVPVEGFKLWFCKKKKGFMSSLLGDVITRRQRVKEIMKKADPDKKKFLDARQESLKVLANSYYGYLAFFGARWYSKDSARSVTAYGRHYIHQVIEAAKAKDFEIVYGDTDSIFLKLGGFDENEAMNFIDDVNAKLPGVMELEFEGMFPRALFVAMKGDDGGAKKKYAMIDEKGNLIIKGFEMVRRNVSLIAKEVQQEVLRIILKENQPELAFEYAKEMINKLRKKEILTDELVISTMLTKSIDSYESIGPHVAAAKLMKQKGMAVVPGMIIRYVVGVGKDKIRDRVKLVSDVKKGEYDAEYYVSHQVIPAVDKIFEVLGFDVKSIAEGKDQTSLGKFF
ncbi:DNA-directed DNA polymerase [Nanoarchaeota archaeon]